MQALRLHTAGDLRLHEEPILPPSRMKPCCA